MPTAQRISLLLGWGQRVLLTPAFLTFVFSLCQRWLASPAERKKNQPPTVVNDPNDLQTLRVSVPWQRSSYPGTTGSRISCARGPGKP